MSAHLDTLKCPKEVSDCLRTADCFDTTGRSEEELGTSKLPIVVKSHGIPVSTGGVDREYITLIDPRELSLDRELIVVFTETTRYTDDLDVRFMLSADGSDMMVRSVHSRTHEILHACVDTDVGSVFFGDIDHTGDEDSCGSCHTSSVFHENLGISEVILRDNITVVTSDARYEHLDIHFVIGRSVGDTDTSSEVDEFEGNTCPAVYLMCELEEYPGSLDESRFASFVGDDHSMESESFHSFFFEYAVCFDDLIAAHTILRFGGFANDRISFLEIARIESTTHKLGYADLFELRDVRDVVKIDDDTMLARIREFFDRCVVGCEHNIFSVDTYPLTEHELGYRATVHTHRLVREDTHDVGIRA